MAVTKKRPKPRGDGRRSFWTGLRRHLNAANLLDFATNPSRCSPYVAFALLAAEVLINLAVIRKVSYTEIDWTAYMQEVEGVIRNGTTDYSLLRGDTGPLVYPAGFVWFYSALYRITDSGTDVRLAQHVFAAIYLSIVALVFRLFLRNNKTLPNFALCLICLTSYRVHSICVLRLFNDPVAMLFLYAGVNAFADDRWSLGSFLYSLAVSVKMNALLFAPALFLAYLATQGVAGTARQLLICAGVQVAVGFPFLASHPFSYLKGGFDLGRVFLFEWTVNWRFLPEEVFLHRGFHAALLLLHASLLLTMAGGWWRSLREYAAAERGKRPLNKLLLPLFTCNLVGVMCARSLHYQFYVWYYHQLHYLCWSGSSWPRLPTADVLRLLVLGVLEMVWNTYPSTALSSGMLHVCHVVILVNVLLEQNKRSSDDEKCSKAK